MLRHLTRILLPLTVALLAACSSAPPKPVVDFDADYSFADTTKIAFYALSGRVSGDNPMGLTDFQKDRIDKALSAALEGKGYEIVDNAKDADLLISWHVNTVEKQDIRTTSSPNYGMSMGYSRYNRYAMYSCYSCFDNTDVRVTDYTQGTFIVDMIDPVANRSVWRSVTQSKLKGEQIKDQATIDQAAVRILAGFPPVGVKTAD